MNYFYLICLVFSLFFFKVSLELSCVDDKGQEVDWWILYKMPELHGNPSSNKNLKRGRAYYWMTPSQPSWTLSQQSITDATSMFGRTIAPIYDSGALSRGVAFAMYNDQPPGKKDRESNGHTKGLLLFDASSLVWLVHSVPHAPNATDTPTWYPVTGFEYGQSAICVTLDAPSSQSTNILDAVSEQLRYTHPFFYDYNISTYAQRYSALESVITGSHVATPPWNRSLEMVTHGGQHLVHFAKASGFGQDLYANWLNSALGQDLFVESWQNGDQKIRMNSSCTGPFTVENVLGLSMPSAPAYPGLGYSVPKVSDVPISFNETQDHAKWAISAPSSCNSQAPSSLREGKSRIERGKRLKAPSGNHKKHMSLSGKASKNKHKYHQPKEQKQQVEWTRCEFSSTSIQASRAGAGNWVCIGDINRQTTQQQRAGGTLCLQHEQVWSAFAKSVIYVEKCKSSEPAASTDLRSSKIKLHPPKRSGPFLFRSFTL